MEKQNKILLVEDDPNLSVVIQDYLVMQGYDTVLCKDGEEGLNAFKKGSFHLIILDVMMPKMDGFSVAEEIRKADEYTPIIFLTAKSLKEDRVKGFKIGCDDYISKPFNTEELSLRIKAILKRCYMHSSQKQQSQDLVYHISRFTFDSENMILKSKNTEQVLTRKESALFALLCSYKNKVLTRETAMKSVWGEDDYFVGRSMDVFIAKLRKYLKSDPNISITNIHGIGFKLEVKDDNQ
jgi:DNA-binding response OmpR family regulator